MADNLPPSTIVQDWWWSPDRVYSALFLAVPASFFPHSSQKTPWVTHILHEWAGWEVAGHTKGTFTFRHPEGPQGPRQGLLGALGVPWGGLGDTLGSRGYPSEATFGEQAGLQNHLFYFVNGNIGALEAVLGDLAGSKVAAKAGVGEVKGDNGARNKPKRKRRGAERTKNQPGEPWWSEAALGVAWGGLRDTWRGRGEP